MSKAAAATVEADVAVEAPPKKGKKKLIIILAAALLVVLAGGGAAVYFMKKRAAAQAAEEEADSDKAAAEAEAKRREHAAKHPPVFVPLEPFVVNLSDKESDRYAQIGVTLEVEDAKFAEQMKAYMPAIRNGILMVLSHKTSAQLLSREGKIALAKEIMRESVLPLGIEVKDAEPAAAAASDDDDEEPAKGKKAAKPAEPTNTNPVRRVHFSNFIVQ